jgi:gamma-glutamylcyclotransferase (GGCT)/AIG2-like uncharacterized protein YtfP
MLVYICNDINRLMEDTNCYLFVYGTLLDSDNAYGRHLLDNSTPWGEAKFKGKLYDVGEYPGAIYQPGGDSYVYGKIYLLNKPGIILKVLDEYEGFGDSEVQPNLFIRGLIEVETEDKTIDCWVYLYNLPVEGFRQILSGDYSGR